uniref:Uncharacterized protein n=1 Tax=Pithovirus LCPAC401 TaxID=2506595 RepID=A0A481ZAS9_9VIRU|nr:MAG: hypothetical protein LCPAC401_03740 [Pithovirus LCPAC401]
MLWNNKEEKSYKNRPKSGREFCHLLDDEATYEYGKRRIPILSKCGNDEKLINAINKYPLHMDR